MPGKSLSQRAIIIFLALCFCTFLPINLTAQDSSFTYQGELKQNGNLASGAFGMDFSLWDSGISGNQLGATLSVSNVSVVNGNFTVELDFGAESFESSMRWLQVEVDGFVLSPRSKVTRSPYSIQTRGIFVSADKKVGLGTTNPQVQLDLESTDESAIRLTTANGNPSSVSQLQFKTFDAPGIFSPLGRIDFVDEQDEIRASFQGTKVGASDAQLSMSVTPGQVPQVTVSSTNVTLAGDLITNGNANVESDLTVGNRMTVESDLFVEDDLFVTSDLVVEGIFSGFDDMSVGGNLFVFDDLFASADVSIQNNLEVSGDLSVSGAVSMGPDDIHPALAYGHVNVGNNTVTASPNIDQVAAISTGRYQITIEGGFQLGDIIVVTSEHHLKNAAARRDPSDLTKVVVEIANVVTGQFSHENYSFVVYRK